MWLNSFSKMFFILVVLKIKLIVIIVIIKKLISLLNLCLKLRYKLIIMIVKSISDWVFDRN